MPQISFRVLGTPVGQGNMRRNPHTGKLYDTTKGLAEWRNNVASVAMLAKLKHGPFDGPAGVRIVFHFERPKTVKRLYPTVPPDLDKCVRAIGDALTASGLWGDDAQVCSIQADKRYSDWEGAEITIRELGE